ncbi:hypothetical protein EMGBS15_17940 [Filimonas sp.]|nr:hypothetical protein EMGBS15_17940 [Filimonas sp.]
MGTIKVEVFADVKQHAENFLKLAKKGFMTVCSFTVLSPPS